MSELRSARFCTLHASEEGVHERDSIWSPTQENQHHVQANVDIYSWSKSLIRCMNMDQTGTPSI